jgi:hypothetical protein
MEKKELINWAIKGINAEIEELDASIRKGNEYLLKLYRGEPVKTKKSVTEIREIIREKKDEMEKLERAKFELKWEE